MTVSGETVLDRAVQWLLDPGALQAAIGHPARTRWLRYKPGLSTIAAVEVDGEPRWLQVSWPEHAAKLDKAVQQASRPGAQIWVGSVPGSSLRWALGPAHTDPALLRAARPTKSPVGARLMAQWTAGQLEVLRYNPRRRLVAKRQGRSGEEVVRLSGESAMLAVETSRRLAASGVRVVDARGVDSRGRISVWPWIAGPGDLAGLHAPDAPAAAELAGRELAALHATVSGPGSVHDQHVLALPRRRQVSALGNLDRDLAARAAAVEVKIRLTDGAARRVHGDFSADQVLVDHDARAWLTDFDRTAFADPRLDLGTFLAVELIERRPAEIGEAFLGGYAPAGSVDPDQLAPWIAHAILTRLDHPFREGQAGWRTMIIERIALAEQVLR